MPRLPLFFARRYLFSKKSHSVINIVSGVSAFSVAIPVMAMVILLSVFNGFEGLIKSMYRSFDPDIRITPVPGQGIPDRLAAARTLSGNRRSAGRGVCARRQCGLRVPRPAGFRHDVRGRFALPAGGAAGQPANRRRIPIGSSEISRKPTSDRAWPTRWASGST